MRHKIRYYICELNVDSNINGITSSDIYTSIKSSIIETAGDSCFGRSQRYLAIRLIGNETASNNSIILIRGPAIEDKNTKTAIILIKSIKDYSCALRIVRVASSLRTLEINDGNVLRVGTLSRTVSRVEANIVYTSFFSLICDEEIYGVD